MEKFIVGILLALFPFAVFANEAEVQIQTCWNLKISADQHDCLAKLDAKFDDNLNTVYQQLKTKLDDKKSLVAAQRAWIKFRNVECDFAGSFAAGGSLEPILRDSTFATLTANRLEQLKQYLKQVE